MTSKDSNSIQERTTPATSGTTSQDTIRPVAVVFIATTLLSIFMMLTNVVWYLPKVRIQSDEGLVAFRVLSFVAIHIAYNVFLLCGAFAMFVRRAYRLALLSCCFAMVPVLGPCGIAGIAIGIWGVGALRKPGVRETFT